MAHQPRAQARSARRRLHRACAAALVLSLASASCTHGQQDAQDVASRMPAAADPATEDPCLPTATSGCAALGGRDRAHRYLVLDEEHQLADADEAVVVDLGGPGLTLFPGNAMELERQLRATLGELVDGRRIILLEEPWVGQDTPEGCAAMLRSLVEETRSALASADAIEVEPGCALPAEEAGWVPELYRQVLTDALAQEGARMVGFVGLSFGAVRATYLPDNDAWTVLVRPAAAVGTDAADVLAARASSLERKLVGACELCSGPSDAHRRVATIVGDLDADPPTVEQRSVPVTGFDFVSALMRAGLDDDEPLLAEVMRDPRGQARRIGELSDALWGRYGSDAIGPTHLAYLNEVCSVYRSWPDAPAGTSLLQALVHAAHAPCQTSEPVVPEGRSSADCMVVGEGDVVTPPELAAKWDVPAHAVLSSPVSDHWLNGADECAAVVGGKW